MKARTIIKRNSHLIPIRRLKIGETCQEDDWFSFNKNLKFKNTKKMDELSIMPTQGHFHIGKTILADSEIGLCAYRKI
jgi:hypothetical protein